MKHTHLTYAVVDGVRRPDHTSPNQEVIDIIQETEIYINSKNQLRNFMFNVNRWQNLNQFGQIQRNSIRKLVDIFDIELKLR